MSQPLVNTNDILLPQLHIKLGLKKNSVIELDKEDIVHLQQIYLHIDEGRNF